MVGVCSYVNYIKKINIQFHRNIIQNSGHTARSGSNKLMSVRSTLPIDIPSRVAEWCRVTGNNFRNAGLRAPVSNTKHGTFIKPIGNQTLPI